MAELFILISGRISRQDNPLNEGKAGGTGIPSSKGFGVELEKM